MSQTTQDESTATPGSAASPTSPGSPEPVDHGHSHLGLALALISAAQLMVVLDGTIVNIALPHIQTDLRFTPANLSWVVNAYTLAFGEPSGPAQTRSGLISAYSLGWETSEVAVDDIRALGDLTKTSPCGLG